MGSTGRTVAALSTCVNTAIANHAVWSASPTSIAIVVWLVVAATVVPARFRGLVVAAALGVAAAGGAVADDWLGVTAGILVAGCDPVAAVGVFFVVAMAAAGDTAVVVATIVLAVGVSMVTVWALLIRKRRKLYSPVAPYTNNDSDGGAETYSDDGGWDMM